MLLYSLKILGMAWMCSLFERCFIFQFDILFYLCGITKIKIMVEKTSENKFNLCCVPSTPQVMETIQNQSAI